MSKIFNEILPELEYARTKAENERSIAPLKPIWWCSPTNLFLLVKYQMELDSQLAAALDEEEHQDNGGMIEW